jgi:flagellar biosynthesis GTPase FlhF
MYKNLQILRENPETANAGKKWTEEEINILLNERKEDKSIEDIAKIHKRTDSSVKSKLLAIAVSLLNKMSIEEASNIVKFSVPTIKQYMEKHPTKPEKPKEEKNINIIDTLGISTLKIEDSVIIKPEIVLNYEQQSALKHFKLGKNIFLTGPAGTGKSVTLNKIKEY